MEDTESSPGGDGGVVHYMEDAYSPEQVLLAIKDLLLVRADIWNKIVIKKCLVSVLFYITISLHNWSDQLFMTNTLTSPQTTLHNLTFTGEHFNDDGDQNNLKTKLQNRLITN